MLRRSALRVLSVADIEARIRSSDALAPVTQVAVHDISGGCGSFFKVEVTSKAFQGKSLLQQHRLVQDVLKKEIAEMHGITVVSRTPATDSPPSEGA